MALGYRITNVLLTFHLRLAKSPFVLGIQVKGRVKLFSNTPLCEYFLSIEAPVDASAEASKCFGSVLLLTCTSRGGWFQVLWITILQQNCTTFWEAYFVGQGHTTKFWQLVFWDNEDLRRPVSVKLTARLKTPLHLPAYWNCLVCLRYRKLKTNMGFVLLFNRNKSSLGPKLAVQMWHWRLKWPASWCFVA
jgi:hypothetical protein